MRTRHGRRALPGMVAMMAAGVLAACTTGMVGGAAAGAATSGSATGVTSSSIKVGAVSTLTGPIAANFKAFVPGEQAYFEMVNAEGGVNGRKITLAWNYTTGGQGSQFTSLVHQLVESDHAFAVGVSSYAFTPAYLVQSGTPTYGWNVVGNWAGPKNLYAAGGSVLFYTSLAPQVAYLMKKTNSEKIGIIGYNVAGSGPACTAAGKDLPKLGVKVVYDNVSSKYGGPFTSTVQRMKSSGVDFVLSCMQDTDNVTLATEMQQYGLKATQYWLTGGTRQLYQKYPTVTTGIYVRTTSVPFTLSSNVAKYYPGLETYLKEMKKYAPTFVTSQVALNGWASAALLVAGLKAAGKNPTQQSLIQATNKIDNFTATGMMTITKWTTAHTKSAGPWCTVFVQVQKQKMVPKFMKGHQVFTCFGLHSTATVNPPSGTPGAT